MCEVKTIMKIIRMLLKLLAYLLAPLYVLVFYFRCFDFLFRQATYNMGPSMLQHDHTKIYNTIKGDRLETKKCEGYVKGILRDVKAK